jgi:hypothetical protein
MTDLLTCVSALLPNTTPGPWEITWHHCRANADDVRHEQTRKLRRGESRRDLAPGDVLWRQATAIGPVFPDHCHWAGSHISCNEADAELISLLPAIAAEFVTGCASRDEEWRSVLETMRPVWAECPDAYITATALAQLWALLGATNQTEAAQKLRALLESDK